MIYDVPQSCYISPEDMVSCFSALKNLESLILSLLFKLPNFNEGGQHLPPPARIALPVLTEFSIKATNQYTEDFISRIDAPLLNDLNIQLFTGPTVCALQLYNFVHRSEGFNQINQVKVMFDPEAIIITSRHGSSKLYLHLICEGVGRQVLLMTQECTQISPLLFHVAVLYITESRDARLQKPNLPEDMEFTQWLEFFHPFPAVKDIYISDGLVPLITPALKELTGQRTMELLPVLRRIFLGKCYPSGSVPEAMKPFLTARRLSGHPVNVHSWEHEE
jgi:hypothetical protein